MHSPLGGIQSGFNKPVVIWFLQSPAEQRVALLASGLPLCAVWHYEDPFRKKRRLINPRKTEYKDEAVTLPVSVNWGFDGTLDSSMKGHEEMEWSDRRDRLAWGGRGRNQTPEVSRKRMSSHESSQLPGLQKQMEAFRRFIVKIKALRCRCNSNLPS